MQSIKLYEEKTLLLRISKGDWGAYTDLVSHYHARLHRYLLPLMHYQVQDTEDLLQEIFLTLWEKREGLPLIHRFDQYLFRIAKNRYLDFLRKENSRAGFIDRYKQYANDQASSPFDHLLYAYYNQEAIKAINTLSDKLKTVFLLNTKEDLSIDEISAMLDLPRETVKKRLYLAIRQVRKSIKQRTGGDINFFSFLLPFFY